MNNPLSHHAMGTGLTLCGLNVANVPLSNHPDCKICLPAASDPAPADPAPVPLLEDGELVEKFRSTVFTLAADPFIAGWAVADCKEAETALLSRLSSLRESVASLTAQRDEARGDSLRLSQKLVYHADRAAPWMADSRPLLAEIEKLAGDRDALRESLEHGCLQCGYVGPNPTKDGSHG